jgi:hypothetical protein
LILECRAIPTILLSVVCITVFLFSNCLEGPRTASAEHYRPFCFPWFASRFFLFSNCLEGPRTVSAEQYRPFCFPWFASRFFSATVWKGQGQQVPKRVEYGQNKLPTRYTVNGETTESKLGTVPSAGKIVSTCPQHPQLLPSHPASYPVYTGDKGVGPANLLFISNWFRGSELVQL